MQISLNKSVKLNTEDAQTRSISSDVTAILRDAIISGEIAQGSKLSETRLAKDLSISRGPLREAIRRLEGMNLVHHKPQHGTRVVILNQDYILQIYDAREALESKAAALAAKRITSNEIDLLNRIIDSQTKQANQHNDARVPAESDYVFHQAIIKAANNVVIEHTLLEEIYHLIKMFRYQNKTNQFSHSNTLTEHKQILYAIEQRDPELAQVTMRRHIVSSRKKVQHFFEQKLKTSIEHPNH